MNALEGLKTLSGDLINPAIEEWKAQGKKVIGFFCSYVPEEILYAGQKAIHPRNKEAATRERVSRHFDALGRAFGL